jgi:serine/threonine protein kinase
MMNGIRPQDYNPSLPEENWEDVPLDLDDAPDAPLDDVSSNDHPGTADPNIPKGALDVSANRTHSASGEVFGSHSVSQQHISQQHTSQQQIIITRTTKNRIVNKTQTPSPTAENDDAWRRTQPAATKIVSHSQKIDKARRVFTNRNGVEFEQYAQGKAKRILTPTTPTTTTRELIGQRKAEPQNVWITPVKTALGSKNKEIKKEIEIMEDIKATLTTEDAQYLSLDMKKVDTKQENIQGQQTYIQPKAKGSLEGWIRKSLTSETRRAFGGHVIQGMAGLHKADYSHNDSKPDNFLVFDEKGKLIIKASDYGKAKKVKNGEADYTGNVRFVAPEGKSSKKGDVYGTGLILIRVFEEQYLKNENNNMLCSIDDKDRDVPLEGDKVRGVEKYVIEHKAFPATQNIGWVGFVRILWRRISKLGKLNNKELMAHQNTIHNYIDELGKRMKKDEDNFRHSDKLIALLKRMTLSDPKQRPRMDVVNQLYQEWQKLEGLPY